MIIASVNQNLRTQFSWAKCSSTHAADCRSSTGNIAGKRWRQAVGLLLGCVPIHNAIAEKGAIYGKAETAIVYAEAVSPDLIKHCGLDTEMILDSAIQPLRRTGLDIGRGLGSRQRYDLGFYVNLTIAGSCAAAVDVSVSTKEAFVKPRFMSESIRVESVTLDSKSGVVVAPTSVFASHLYEFIAGLSGKLASDLSESIAHQRRIERLKDHIGRDRSNP